MLLCLRQYGNFQSLERNGFADIFQAVLDIKLLVACGTSWLKDGPAGYTEAMQMIFDLGQKAKDAPALHQVGSE